MSSGPRRSRSRSSALSPKLSCVIRPSIEQHPSLTGIQELTSSSREEFLKDCKGKLNGIKAIYRHNDSASAIGVFDKELIEGLPESVEFICHNGAGYDQSELARCAPEWRDKRLTPV